MQVDLSRYVALLTEQGVVTITVLEYGASVSGELPPGIFFTPHSNGRMAYHAFDNHELLETFFSDQLILPEFWIELRAHDDPFPEHHHPDRLCGQYVEVRTGALYGKYGYVAAQATDHDVALDAVCEAQLARCFEESLESAFGIIV